MTGWKGVWKPRVKAAIAAATVLALSGCTWRASPTERIVFASNRGDPPGSRHLWAISPDGDPQTLVQQTRGATLDGYPSFSPDGTLLAFSRANPATPENPTIWLRSMKDGREWRVTEGASDTADIHPSWAPGGGLLVFTRLQRSQPDDTALATLLVVPILVSAEGVRAGRPLPWGPADGVSRHSGSWNQSTGAEIVFMKHVGGTNPFAIWRAPYPDGPEYELVPHDCCGNYHPRWSPDGRRIAYVSFDAGASGQIVVADADGTHRTAVTCAGSWGLPAWSPDSRQLVVQSSRSPGLWRVQVPVANGTCLGEPAAVTTGGFQDTAPTWGSSRSR